MRRAEIRAGKGIHNLLINCAACQRGQKLLLVHEIADDGYHDPRLIDDVHRVAEGLGLGVHCYAAPFDRDVNDPQPELAALMRDADWTIFLARLWDRSDFAPEMPNGSKSSITRWIGICWRRHMEQLISGLLWSSAT